jgi:hypothetical protein
MPYLFTPSLSFLIYLSPQAYLAILRRYQLVTSADKHPILDISTHHLRSLLSTIQLPGVCMVTLGVMPMKASLRLPHVDMTLSTRPIFILTPGANVLDHNFPTPQEHDQIKYCWCLDFTLSGQFPGIVMTQSRMQEIEGIVNSMEHFGAIGPGPTTGLGNRSWLDMLVCSFFSFNQICLCVVCLVEFFARALTRTLHCSLRKSPYCLIQLTWMIMFACRNHHQDCIRHLNCV